MEDKHMIKISVREFTHHISQYMKRAHNGERLVITKRDRPFVDLCPPHAEKMPQGWSMEQPRKYVKGLSLSQELTHARSEERA